MWYYIIYIYTITCPSFFPQLIIHLLSKSTITTIVSLFTTGHSYAFIKAQTGASAGFITKIHQDYCPEVAVSSGGCPKKLTTANILYTKYVHSSNSTQCSKVNWNDFCGQTEEAIVGCQT